MTAIFTWQVRNVEVKNTMEEEWSKFQKEMETQQQVRDALHIFVEMCTLWVSTFMHRVVLSNHAACTLWYTFWFARKMQCSVQLNATGSRKYRVFPLWVKHAWKIGNLRNLVMGNFYILREFLWREFVS